MTSWLRTLKVSVTATLVAGTLLVGGLLVSSARQARMSESLLEQAYGEQRELVRGTHVRLAAERLERDRYRRLLRAETKLNGTLLAAVAIRVAARDTIIEHDTVATELQPDSTRVASTRDSTFAGVIEVQVRAPPCCAPLGITTSVRRPAFTPTVGFVAVAGRTIAVVEWQGERVELESPYASPQLQPQPRIQPFAEVLYDVTQTLTFRAGAQARGWAGFSAVAALDQRIGDPARMQVGLRKTF